MVGNFIFHPCSNHEADKVILLAVECNRVKFFVAIGFTTYYVSYSILAMECCRTKVLQRPALCHFTHRLKDQALDVCG